MAKIIHENLVNAVGEALHLIFQEGKYADRVIESTLKKNSKWGSRDRRFIAETTYDVVRWWRWISSCGEIEETDENKFRKAIDTWLVLQDSEERTWENENIEKEKIIANSKNLQSARAIRESVPDWLDELGQGELPDKWEKELHALNEQARVVLRTNTIKTSIEDLREALRLADCETETLPSLPNALLLMKRANVFQQPVFKQGWFELQDASSQTVAPFLEIQPGMRVVDACAGAGGKTLHIAALMQNKGQLIALDTEGWKLQELRHRARRAGAGMIETRTIDTTKVIKRLYDSADRVLLDVPCSGLGVIRRNPDAKWKLNLEYINRVHQLQKEIIERYSRMVKPGGKVVYATCSILPSENQLIVEQFLLAHPVFRLEEERQIFPSEGFDGFYMARLVRIN
ncbi:MAG: RsmB/NOP family class I SAM-dependent RNA methyltransferase [Chitinophagales bacterium]